MLDVGVREKGFEVGAGSDGVPAALCSPRAQVQSQHGCPNLYSNTPGLLDLFVLLIAIVATTTLLKLSSAPYYQLLLKFVQTRARSASQTCFAACQSLSC